MVKFSPSQNILIVNMSRDRVFGPFIKGVLMQIRYFRFQDFKPKRFAKLWIAPVSSEDEWINLWRASQFSSFAWSGSR
jgi:hypothetical protein